MLPFIIRNNSTIIGFMLYLINTIHLFFLCYMILLIGRILGSWLPKLQHTSIMRFIAHYTDPYLHIFRRFIPPIGGVLDLSPLIGFFVLRIGEKIVIMGVIYIFHLFSL